MIKVRTVLFALSVSIVLLLCGCDDSKSFVESDMNSVCVGTTTVTSVSETTIKSSNDLPEDDIDNNTNTSLPKEAENALFEYLKCDSFDSLADSIYPSSVSEEMKNSNVQLGNYFFGGFPFGTHEDIEILECTRRSLSEVQNLAAFWAMGASLQGVTADFSAEDGYDVIVAATLMVEGEMEDLTLRVTEKLTILKIIDDRWIVVPSSDTETYNVEVIE